MGFNNEDKKWIDRCRNDPKKYWIKVDNDAVWVEWDSDDPDIWRYQFSMYGEDFIIQLLNYIGCTADYI